MFYVPDDRPGSHAAAGFARPGPLRVYAHVRASADAAGLTGLRVLLTADLLARAAELGGLQVLTTRAFTGDPAGLAAVERAAEAFGVFPPVLPAADPGEAWPGGPAAVHVLEDSAVGEAGHGGILIRAAAARLARDARPGDPDAGLLGEHDPITVRFALMSVPRHEPAELTVGKLADAARTLGEWRHHVAVWAESPSGAIPEPIAATIRTALGNLDIVAVLALLMDLAADRTVPPGVRFETFVYADRVLGLDLPSDIGRFLPGQRRCKCTFCERGQPLSGPLAARWCLRKCRLSEKPAVKTTPKNAYSAQNRMSKRWPVSQKIAAATAMPANAGASSSFAHRRIARQLTHSPTMPSMTPHP